MPPRKRAAAAPKTQPAGKQEGLEAPDTEETPEADSVEEAAPDQSAGPDSPADPASANLPCTVCFPDGWPDGVTARGCEHGSWTRA
jgi:hypothetical protein